MSRSLISSSFLEKLKAEYEIFAKFTETSLPVNWLTLPPREIRHQKYFYSKEETVDGAIFSRDFFLPKGMIVSWGMNTSCYCLGRTPQKEEFNNDQVRHVMAFYNILHLLWIGYFQFIKALENGQPKILTDFISEATPWIKIPETGRKDAFVNENNKNNLLMMFVGSYALHLLMTQDKTISTRARIEAIRFWAKLDPEMKCLNWSSWYEGKIDLDKGLPDLLPSSFQSDHLPGKTYTRSAYHENKKIWMLFGNPFCDQERLPLGLKVLFSEHKAEAIQITEGLLRMGIGKKFIVLCLYRLTEFDDETLALIFGEKASYRNGGMVTENTDELNHLSSEMLKQMVLTLRQKNQELEKIQDASVSELTAEVEKYRQAYNSATRNLTILTVSLSYAADYKQYFSILGFSIKQNYSQIEPFLELHYRHLSIKYHPDKTGNDEKQKLLNEAIAVFRDFKQFKQYCTECDAVIMQKANELFS